MPLSLQSSLRMHDHQDMENYLLCRSEACKSFCPIACETGAGHEAVCHAAGVLCHHAGCSGILPGADCVPRYANAKALQCGPAHMLDTIAPASLLPVLTVDLLALRVIGSAAHDCRTVTLK